MDDRDGFIMIRLIFTTIFTPALALLPHYLCSRHCQMIASIAHWIRQYPLEAHYILYCRCTRHFIAHMHTVIDDGRSGRRMAIYWR